MGRRPCCDKEKVKKGPWSEEEDKMLKAYIEKYGTGGSWIALPQKIGLKRCGKSCRLRWLNYLRPNIKHGPFSEEEDNIICSLYMTIGSRWSIIAAQLQGRTDNDIKNYWNSRLKKKLLGRYKEFNCLPAINPEGEVVNEMNGDGKCSPSLNLLARERIQLHQQLQSLQTSPLFYNPSVWPSSYSIGEAILQSQYNDWIECNPNMVLVSATQIESSHNFMSFNQNRGPDDPLNRFMAPAIAIAYETTMTGNYVNQSNSSFPMEPGLHSELNDIVSGRANIFTGKEDQQNNIHLIEEPIRTTWGDHNFDSESSLLSWDSSSTLQKDGMTHEYVIGFNP